jgi:hypothetical protein
LELTTIMLSYRKEVLEPACERAGVHCETVVIADDANLEMAEALGFHTVKAPNVLGAKFNAGYEFAVENGFDWAFHVNSDQVFDPRLIIAIANTPTDNVVTTSWLSAVHESGRTCISYQNPIRAMQAFPVKLLRNCPRPCAEDIMSGCDRSTMDGFLEANPGLGKPHRVTVGPLETIQFESEVQLTGWGRHITIGYMNGRFARDVPWQEIEDTYGAELVSDMRSFYDTRTNAVRGS